MNDQPPLSVPDEIEAADMPRSVQDAVGWLTINLSQTVMDELASMPEDELIDHHFGLGAWIRRIFHLNGRHGNPRCLQTAKKSTMPGMAMQPLLKGC